VRLHRITRIIAKHYKQRNISEKSLGISSHFFVPVQRKLKKLAIATISMQTKHQPASVCGLAIFFSFVSFFILFP
jgi:hypothetical protein